MLEKLKGLVVKFVKPLLLDHLKDLSLLTPMLTKEIVAKTHMAEEQADGLAKHLIVLVQTELAVLINKI